MAGVRHGSALFYAADACCWWGPGGGLAVTRQEFWTPESFDFSVPSHTAVVSGGKVTMLRSFATLYDVQACLILFSTNRGIVD